MSKLDDFLGLTDVSEVRGTVTVKVGDKVLDMVVRPLTAAEHNDFQKMATKMNNKKTTFDITKYNDLILENCIVEPNFRASAFLKEVGCISAIDFLRKKLPAGTIMEISSQIQKLSGFDSYEVEVEEAKN